MKSAMTQKLVTDRKRQSAVCCIVRNGLRKKNVLYFRTVTAMLYGMESSRNVEKRK